MIGALAGLSNFDPIFFFIGSAGLAGSLVSSTLFFIATGALVTVDFLGTIGFIAVGCCTFEVVGLTVDVF